VAELVGGAGRDGVVAGAGVGPLVAPAEDEAAKLSTYVWVASTIAATRWAHRSVEADVDGPVVEGDAVPGPVHAARARTSATSPALPGVAGRPLLTR
jgi:hypothetical protein